MRTALLVLAFSLAGSGTAFAQQAAAPPPPPPTMHGGGGGMIGALMSADANGDGIITREELLASSDAMFARLDTNHDGVISPDEMQAGRPMRRGGTPPSGDLGATPPPPPAPPGPGGTGMTRQQWHDRALRQFDRIDANHDGRIDQTEIANYREAMRQRRMERRGGGDMPQPPTAGATPPPAADQQ